MKHHHLEILRLLQQFPHLRISDMRRWTGFEPRNLISDLINQSCVQIDPKTDAYRLTVGGKAVLEGLWL